MPFETWWIVVIWLLIGAVCAGVAYWDMKRRKRVRFAVAAICVPLSIIGLLFYLSTRDMSKERGRELPPKPNYGKPEYRFRDQQAEPARTKKDVQVPEVVNEDRMPATPEEEVAMPAPPSVERKEQPQAEKPHKHVQQIEGIPRCPECGAAISTYDIKCPNCGTQLK